MIPALSGGLWRRTEIMNPNVCSKQVLLLTETLHGNFWSWLRLHGNFWSWLCLHGNLSCDLAMSPW